MFRVHSHHACATFIFIVITFQDFLLINCKNLKIVSEIYLSFVSRSFDLWIFIIIYML